MTALGVQQVTSSLYVLRGKLVIHVDDLKTKSHTQDMIRKKRKHIVVDQEGLLADAFAQLKQLYPVGLSN